MVGRKKLNRTSLHARVNPETPGHLKEMAIKLNFTYVNSNGEIEGSTGKLLDAIAQSHFLIPILKEIFGKSG